jgi:hypothetical protein
MTKLNWKAPLKIMFLRTKDGQASKMPTKLKKLFLNTKKHRKEAL